MECGIVAFETSAWVFAQPKKNVLAEVCRVKLPQRIMNDNKYGRVLDTCLCRADPPLDFVLAGGMEMAGNRNRTSIKCKKYYNTVGTGIILPRL